MRIERWASVIVGAAAMLALAVAACSRDNPPDPIPSRASPYVPSNSPATGDLMDMFQFPSK